jgi:hypothetical protein
LDSLGSVLVTAFCGIPYVPLRELPGRPALVVLALTLVVGVVSVGLALAPRRKTLDRSSLSSPVALMALLTLGTPVGVFLYSLASQNILVARTFSASLPAALLLIGWLVVNMRRLPALAVVTFMFGALAVGTVKTLDDDFRRPPYKEAAHFIDAHAQAEDPVIQFFQPNTIVARHMSIYFRSPHDLFAAAIDDQGAWKRGAKGARVFVVVPQTGLLRGVPRRLGPDRLPLRDYRIYPGWIDLGVFEYRR